MSKFIVITKKDIAKSIFTTLAIFLVFFILYLLFFCNKPPFSLYTLNNIKEFNKDFDGDGLDETLITEKIDGFYNIKIKSSKSEYTLTSKTNGINLVDINQACDIKFDFIDLSRDNIPEIIITGTKDKLPVSYIFQCRNNNFEEALFTNKNILGIIDSKNSRTPLVFNTTSTKGDEDTAGIIIDKIINKDISFYKYKIPGLGNIQSFIDLIQLNYELTDTPALFSSYIPSSELGILWNLDKSKFRYNFQNAYFKDIDWTSQGITKSIIWILSFERVNILDSKTPSEELVLYVKTTLDELGEYKIYSITR